MPTQERQAIIIPGSGLHTDQAFGYQLSWDARFRLMAAATLLNEKPSREQIAITTGGRVYPKYPQLSDLSASFLGKHVYLGQEIIRLTGLNTVEEVRETRTFLEQMQVPGTIISNEYHLVAQMLAERYGLAFRSAEDVLRSHHPMLGYILDKLVNSGEYQQLIKGQQNLSRILQIPFVGEDLYRALSRASLASRAKITAYDPNDPMQQLAQRAEDLVY